MVREPDATMQPTPHDNQLMSKHRILSLKPQLRLEWRGQDGQNEMKQSNHSASLGDSINHQNGNAAQAAHLHRFSQISTRIGSCASRTTAGCASLGALG